MNTEKIVFACLGGILVIGAIAWIFIALCIAHTKMDLMLKHLKNSALISTLAKLKQGGIWGRLLLVGSISGVLAFPSFYIKRGRANVEDINQFPVLLKRKLVVLQWGGIVLMSASVFLCLIGKFFDYLK